MSAGGFTDEQRAFTAAVTDFCRREADTREQRSALTGGGRESHSPELYARFAAAGLLGVGIPEEYGGSGGGLMDQCLLFEHLFHGLAPLHGAGPSHTVAGIYKHYGDEQQKKSLAIEIEAARALTYDTVDRVEAGTDRPEELVRRTSIPTTIYAGTNEIQREIISSTYGLR